MPVLRENGPRSRHITKAITASAPSVGVTYAYADGSEELYDMHADRNEWINLADKTEHADIKRQLAKWLPKIDLPPAPGSTHRVLAFDKKTGAVVWEGKPVDKNAPLPTP